MLEHVRTMAAYNRWANDRLYEAACDLPDAEYRADRGAFFGSLHGTLNHILVADRAWLRRIEGDGPSPPALDAILYDDLPALTEARQSEDARILALSDRLTEEQLAATLSYRTMAGAPHEQPLSQVLMHVFNHQTHHRGQAHGILTGLDRTAPPLDLIYFFRDVGSA